MQMFKRKRKHKSGKDNIRIVYDFWCKIVFYILEVDYKDS
jgi:hypothetical protein